jgi:hypothetical protein
MEFLSNAFREVIFPVTGQPLATMRLLVDLAEFPTKDLFKLDASTAFSTSRGVTGKLEVFDKQFRKDSGFGSDHVLVSNDKFPSLKPGALDLDEAVQVAIE